MTKKIITLLIVTIVSGCMYNIQNVPSMQYTLKKSGSRIELELISDGLPGIREYNIWAEIGNGKMIIIGRVREGSKTYLPCPLPGPIGLKEIKKDHRKYLPKREAEDIKT